jgi:membrane-bound lytic murein transglycosylase B
MESNFGSFQGNKSVIRSLATLAYEGRRPEFAQAN